MTYSKGYPRAALASAFVVATTLSAAALDPSSEKIGRWTVWSNADFKNPAACAATVSNGKDELRLFTDGRVWKVGTGYSGAKKKIEAYVGFGTAAEVFDFTVDDAGWAMVQIGRDQLDAFRTAPTWDMTIGTASRSWKLAGAGPAIDRAIECSRSRGLRPAAAPPQAAPPMAAPPMPAAAAGSCPAKGALRSQNSSRPVAVRFVNLSKGPLDIYWIGYQGEWKKYHRMAPNSNVEQKTFATHPWIAVDPRGRCLGGVMMPDPNDRTEGANMFQIWD